jgi:hypothetical protein
MELGRFVRTVLERRVTGRSLKSSRPCTNGTSVEATFEARRCHAPVVVVDELVIERVRDALMRFRP